jgi:HK97 family phage prohead protease
MKLHTALGVSFAVKSVNSKARRFAGLASTWEKDLGDDIIHPGAFTKTLSDWRGSSRKTIPLLDSHDRFSVDSVLGKMVVATETADGLETEFEMRDTAKAAEALAAIEGGFISGLSIGYEPIGPKYEKTDSGKTIRHLHEIKLREVSLVVFPMNEGARVDPSSVKSLIDAAKAGQLTDDQWAELLALHPKAATTPEPEKAKEPDAPKGIAPDDPARIALSAQLRALKLRSLSL